jgi:hypothetical protein
MTMSLVTPGWCSEVADGVTQNNVSLFREPDGVTPPVRFDERKHETEPCQTGLRRRCESLVNSHQETKATARVLDSTESMRFYLWWGKTALVIRWEPSTRQ